jgi:hypothetical protein
MLHLDAPGHWVEEVWTSRLLLLTDPTSVLAERSCIAHYFPAWDGTSLDEAREECDQAEVIGWT